MSNLWLYIWLVGLAIIIPLAFYAVKLLKQLRRQEENQKKVQEAQHAALKQHDKKIFDSVLLITRAMQQEQCEFDEGSWRISVLLSSLKTQSGMPEKFPSIYALYAEIKNLAILDARKALTKKERMREDYQRMVALDKSHDDVVGELGTLHQFTTEQLSVLNS